MALEQLVYRIIEGEEDGDILPISSECPPPQNELDRLLLTKYPRRAAVTMSRAVWELIERELGQCETSDELVYAWSFIKPLLHTVSADAAKQITSLALMKLKNAHDLEMRGLAQNFAAALQPIN